MTLKASIAIESRRAESHESQSTRREPYRKPVEIWQPLIPLEVSFSKGYVRTPTSVLFALILSFEGRGWPI